MKWKKCNVFVFLFVILIFLSIGSKNLLAEEVREEEESRRILFISSYSYSWTAVPEQISGIQEELGDQYIVNYEFMDTKNTVYSENYKEYYNLLKYKLSTRKSYDAVIVGDDAALNFVELYQDELFENTPIVFEGIDNIENAKAAAQNPYITGIAEKLDYKKNIELAGKFFPDAKNLIFILLKLRT